MGFKHRIADQPRRLPELPVLKIESALHIIADMTLELGEVVYDYLPPQKG